MENLCSFPNLPDKYDRALRDAVSFVLERFKPVGIIATGTILRGTPDATSDLDIWVIHLEPMRQRIQKFFSGVPAEIFVNPPWVIQKYLIEDQAAARPISAHMMATGTVVLALDPIVEDLRRRSCSLLNQAPTVSAQAVTQARYAAATKLEDAADIVERQPVAANMLLSQAVVQMLHFAFMKAGTFIPRDKDLLKGFERIDLEAASNARLFFETADCHERLRLANAIADRILGVRGFFEWSSEPENTPRPPIEEGKHS